MEYAERPLTTEIRGNREGLPLAQVKLLIWQLCQAVRFLHKVKVGLADVASNLYG